MVASVDNQFALSFWILSERGMRIYNLKTAELTASATIKSLGPYTSTVEVPHPQFFSFSFTPRLSIK